ncbi:type III secretion system translocon subunit SctE [Shewanella sp. 202IG2-18]|uniref:type III secretion system translocon subunit SctE n=1 Tax=Parashewanella hymeniacidonis TaxID=2807618 RepID=UPI00195F2CD3|nr:type III secretion system translocon subunit SctE [Parashewanella hymeniacidonis]MBM7071443.1 type III secretion system translocon subunit SctE [Parashewanella hymeniacidonis]
MPSGSGIAGKPGVHIPHVGTPDYNTDLNPNLIDASNHAIKKATSLPHFNQSAGALLSHVDEQDKKQKKEQVSFKDYDQSTQNILNAITHNAKPSSPEMKAAIKSLSSISGRDLPKIDMRALTGMMGNLCLSVFSATADAKSRASKIMTDSQCDIRDKKVKQYQDQLKQQADAAKKAKKLGIFACVVDWVVSIAEQIYGLFKLVEGVVEAVASFGCDPNAYASVVAGAAYFTAGVVGMVKAAAETAKLCGADPKICDKVAEIAGYIQLGVEMVGLATDIFGAGMAFKAASGAVKGAAEAATKAAGEEVMNAVTKAGTEGAEEGVMEMTELGANSAAKSIEEVSEKIAEEVSEKLGDSIVTRILNQGVKEIVEEAGKEGYNLGKEALKDTVKNVFKRVTKAFGKDAIKSMVKDSLKESMEAAAKQSSKGVNRSLTRIISDMNVKLMKRCATAALKVAVKGGFLTAVFGLGQSISQGGKGANAIVQGNFTKAIQTLITQQGFLGLLDQDMDSSRKEEEKQIKDVLSKSATVLQNVKDMQEQMMQVSVQVAVNISR